MAKAGITQQRTSDHSESKKYIRKNLCGHKPRNYSCIAFANRWRTDVKWGLY